MRDDAGLRRGWSLGPRAASAPAAWALVACLAVAAGVVGCSGDGESGSEQPTAGRGGTATGGAFSGGVAGTGGASCMEADLLQDLGRDHLLIGGHASTSFDAAVLDANSFDVRYRYVAGGAATTLCSTCDSSCEAWWGCWQAWNEAPGDWVRGFVADAEAAGQIPMFSIWQMPPTFGEGDASLQAIANASSLARYLDDYWGYAQRYDADPHAISASVPQANPTDCADLENSLAGLAECFVAMARTYAPGARVGLHASGWAVDGDINSDTSTSYDVGGDAAQVVAYPSRQPSGGSARRCRSRGEACRGLGPRATLLTTGAGRRASRITVLTEPRTRPTAA